MTGLYSVSWPEHATDRTASVKDMLTRQAFVDVTLACDDDQLEAHKVLLSAASPFFQRILERNPHAHPLLYLRGALKKDVLAVLNFIYSGETSVPVQDFETFMSLAKDLQVKGLVDENDIVDTKPSNNSNKSETDIKRKVKEKEKDHSLQNNEENDDVDVKPNLDELRSNLDMQVEEVELEQRVSITEPSISQNSLNENKDVTAHRSNGKQVKQKPSENTINHEKEIVNNSELVDNDLIDPVTDASDPMTAELNAKVDSLLVTTADGFWVCNECRYGSKNEAHVREHIEMHLDGVAHKCKTCDRVFTKRTSLRFHSARCQKK